MKKFELKKEHVLLLSNIYTSWDDCEFGAAQIDPKRPYGNSDVYQDMVEILGLKRLKGCVYKLLLFNKEYLLEGEDFYNIEFDDEDELTSVLNKLHRETQTALEIILHTKSFKPGLYEAEEYSNKWKKA